MDWKSIGENSLSGSLSSLGTGLITGGLNQIFAGANARRQFRTWQRMQDYMNEYNSPVKQVERLKQAGLNPGLMYSGNSGSSLSASVAPPSGGSATGVQADPMALRRMENETKVSEATANRENAQAELLRSQKVGQDNENSVFAKRWDNELKMFNATFTGTELQNEAQKFINDLNKETKDIQVHTLQQTLKNLISTGKLTDEQTAYWIEQTALVKVEQELTRENINVSRAQVADLMASIQLKGKQGEYYVAQASFLDLQGERVEFDLEFDRKHYEDLEIASKYGALGTYENYHLTQNKRLDAKFALENRGKVFTAQMVNMYTDSFKNVAVGCGAVMHGGAMFINNRPMSTGGSINNPYAGNPYTSSSGYGEVPMFID